MGLLASFVRFKLDFGAGSGSLSTAENGQFAETRTATAASPLGYYQQCIFEFKNYSGAYTQRERGMFGIHWINLTSGELDQTWVAADYAACESAVEAFWTALLSKIGTDTRYVEHRWYAYGAGIVPPNPPSRVTTLATPIQGTSTNIGPKQVSCTVTLRTTLRRHWGRIYVPIAAGVFGVGGGQLSSADADTIASAARTMLTVTPAAQGVVPVVWDRNRKLAFGTTAVEVDSVPDVQRRRRPRDTGYKKIHTS